MTTPITLSVPARPDFVHVLRTLVATVAAKQDFSIDEIEDLRLVVDEACAYLLAIRPPAQSLRMVIASGPGAVSVRTWTDGGPTHLPAADAQQNAMWSILSALADNARIDIAESGAPAIVVEKRRQG